MQKAVASIVILLLFVSWLSACGQKGPLVLPGDPGQLQSIPPTEQQPADENDEDEERPITNRN